MAAARRHVELHRLLVDDTQYFASGKEDLGIEENKFERIQINEALHTFDEELITRNAAYGSSGSVEYYYDTKIYNFFCIRPIIPKDHWNADEVEINNTWNMNMLEDIFGRYGVVLWKFQLIKGDIRSGKKDRILFKNKIHLIVLDQEDQTKKDPPRENFDTFWKKNQNIYLNEPFRVFKTTSAKRDIIEYSCTDARFMAEIITGECKKFLMKEKKGIEMNRILLWNVNKWLFLFQMFLMRFSGNEGEIEYDIGFDYQETCVMQKYLKEDWKDKNCKKKTQLMRIRKEYEGDRYLYDDLFW